MGGQRQIWRVRFASCAQNFRLRRGQRCSILFPMFRAKAETFGRELASNPIARAFAVSLLLHVAGISGIELGARLGWWERSILSKPGNSRLVEEVLDTAKERQQALQKQIPEAQLVFVEVDPSQAVQEAPKDAKHYSSQNTVASNPDPGDEKAPKIDGEQDKVPKTFDVLKPTPQPVQPAPQPQTKSQAKALQPAPKAERPVVEEKQEPAREQKPGETMLARAAPRPNPAPPQPEEKRRPRTVAEAKAQKGIIEGQKMRNDGGARKHSLGTNLDVRATPFGAYDAMFIEAVQARWYSLLDEREFVGGEAGKVVVEFKLNYDGRITALRVVESEVTEVLSWFCQRAVLDPAPYRPFPSDLRRMLNHDYREVRFTFYYNQ